MAHRVSDFLQDRWPVLPEVRENGSLSLSVAYGDRKTSKLADRLASGELDAAQTVTALELLVTVVVPEEVSLEAAEHGLLPLMAAYALQAADASIRSLALRVATCLLRHEVARKAATADVVLGFADLARSDPDAGVRRHAASLFGTYLASDDGRSFLLASCPDALRALVAGMHETHDIVGAVSLVIGEHTSAVPLLLECAAVPALLGLCTAAVEAASDPAKAAVATRRDTSNWYDAFASLRGVVRDEDAKLVAIEAGAVQVAAAAMTARRGAEAAAAVETAATLADGDDSSGLAGGAAAMPSIPAATAAASPSSPAALALAFDPDVRLAAAGTLVMLSVPREGRINMLEAGGGMALAALLEALSDPDTRVQASAATALQTLADFPRGRTAVCRGLLSCCGAGACVAVLGPRACGDLVAVLAGDGDGDVDGTTPPPPPGSSPHAAAALAALFALVMHKDEDTAMASRAAVADTVAAQETLQALRAGAAAAVGDMAAPQAAAICAAVWL